MFVATNKRYAPTRKIIEHLRWTDSFEGTYTLDGFTPSLASKAQLLERMFESTRLAKESCVYVGDRHEDFLAAKANQTPFIFVTWGYGKSDSKAFGYREISSPGDLVNAIAAI
jgi:phosphoglycolate phosphatase